VLLPILILDLDRRRVRPQAIPRGLGCRGSGACGVLGVLKASGKGACTWLAR